MKYNILIITDNTPRELWAMKALEAELTDSDIPSNLEFDYRRNTIETDKVKIYFHSLNSARLIPTNGKTVGCSIFMLDTPTTCMIEGNIRRYRKIEEILHHMPETAVYIPFERIADFISEQ